MRNNRLNSELDLEVIVYFLTPFQFKYCDVLQVLQHFRIKTLMSTKVTSLIFDSTEQRFKQGLYQLQIKHCPSCKLYSESITVLV